MPILQDQELLDLNSILYFQYLMINSFYKLKNSLKVFSTLNYISNTDALIFKKDPATNCINYYLIFNQFIDNCIP